jgi:hypothetical protein
MGDRRADVACRHTRHRLSGGHARRTWLYRIGREQRRMLADKPKCLLSCSLWQEFAT